MIVNNDTNIVTHDNTFVLTENGAVKGRFTDTSVNTSNATQIDNIQLPVLFNKGQFTYIDGEFELTPYGVEKMQKYLIGQVDIISAKFEFGNIDFNDSVINTSKDSQARINGAYSAVLINPDRIIDFKNTDGSWSQIDATTMTAIAEAVTNHVQSCFSNEKILCGLIKERTTYRGLMEIDLTFGWPTVVNNPFNVDIIGV